MSPYDLESLPHTLKRVRTQPIFALRPEVMPLQVIGKTPGSGTPHGSREIHPSATVIALKKRGPLYWELFWLT